MQEDRDRRPLPDPEASGGSDCTSCQRRRRLMPACKWRSAPTQDRHCTAALPRQGAACHMPTCGGTTHEAACAELARHGRPTRPPERTSSPGTRKPRPLNNHSHSRRCVAPADPRPACGQFSTRRPSMVARPPGTRRTSLPTGPAARGQQHAARAPPQQLPPQHLTSPAGYGEYLLVSSHGLRRQRSVPLVRRSPFPFPAAGVHASALHDSCRCSSPPVLSR